MRFPIKKYKNINKFTKDFSFELKKKIDEIDLNNLNKILNILSKVYKSNSKILICGNGGSAALANHFACDHQKIIFEFTNINPHFHSLCSNNSLITAISNDNGYDKVFSDQIKQIGKKNDVLIVISSSGNSKNILNALKEAKKIKIKTLSLTGFYGGKAKKI